jgi:hypothetical protein
VQDVKWKCYLFLSLHLLYGAWIAQWYSTGLDDWRFKSWQGLGIFLFTTTSRLALGPTQPPIQWVPGALYLRVKWLGCEADHTPPPSAKIKDWVELYVHSLNMP